MSEITTQISDYCHDLLCKQAQAALKAAPDYLSMLAEETDFPNERTLYLDTMHELGFAKQKVYDRFSSEVHRPFSVLSTGEIPEEFKQRAGVVMSNISGAGDLEEKLALETMLSKAKAKSELSLHNISRGLDAFLGNDWSKRHYNPLDPEFIIRAWLKAVYEMQLDAKGNLAMYAILDSQLLSRLPALYENIGRFMESLASARKQKSTRNQSQSAEQAKLPSATEADDFETLFGDIDNSQPQADYGDDGASPFDDADEPPDEINTQGLIEAIDRLQRDRDLDDSDYYANNYLIDFRALFTDRKITPEGVINPWTIGQINDDVIDMTRLMFTFILDDYNLPDDIRYHVSRLQLPYLKLGLYDKTLFTHKEHPARQLLMDITQSISTWDPSHTGGLDLLLTEIIRLVDEVLEHYRKNHDIFGSIQRHFSAFLEGDTHIDEALQDRQRARASQRSKTDNAKLSIESTLRDYCEDKRVPPIVEKILENYWSQVLFLEYLKGGEESDEFKELLGTVEILLDTVQPKYSEQERKQMAKNLPVIVKRLKAGLNNISVASFESVDLFRELQQCHMEVLKEHPENTSSAPIEVNEDEYDAFKEAQQDDFVWDRTAIEATMLEENIERSIAMSPADSHAFDDNPNIICAAKPEFQDVSTAKAEREKQIIDDELREARDAYELALKEHQDKKRQEQPDDLNEEDDDSDDDDFMSMFFRDPEFDKHQTEDLHNSTNDTEGGTTSSDDDNEMDHFAQEVDLDELDDLEQESSPTESDAERQENSIVELKQDALAEIENDDLAMESMANSPQTEPDEQPSIKQDTSPPKQKSDVADDARGRAHGAINEGFEALGDDMVQELIERLKVGLWVDLYHADNTKVRAKIMAIVPSVGKYIFGNRSGKKLADFNRESLYEALQTGRIRLQEVDSAYDKTLESVIANLRIMKKAEDD